MDLYVFDCTSEEGECRASRTDGDPVGDEFVWVADPSPGKWKIVVDASRVPSDSAELEYLDAVFNPVYGMVNTTDLPQERGVDARWMAKVHTWIAPAAYEAGREPWAALLVQGRTSGGAPYFLTLGAFAAGSPASPDRDRN